MKFHAKHTLILASALVFACGAKEDRAQSADGADGDPLVGEWIMVSGLNPPQLDSETVPDMFITREDDVYTLELGYTFREIQTEALLNEGVLRGVHDSSYTPPIGTLQNEGKHLLVNGHYYRRYQWADSEGPHEQQACVGNMMEIQRAVRRQEQMYMDFDGPIDDGEVAISWDRIFGDKEMMQKPTCPSGGIYTFSKTMPKAGTAACRCSLAGSKGHKPRKIEY